MTKYREFAERVHRNHMLHKLLNTGNEIYVEEELEALDISELRLVCLGDEANGLVESYNRNHGSQPIIMAKFIKKRTEYENYLKTLKETSDTKRIESIKRNYPVRNSIGE